MINILKLNLNSSAPRTGDFHSAGIDGACQCIVYAVLWHKENQDKFGAETIRLLMRLLEAYASNPETQREIHNALDALIKGNPANMAVFKMHGGLEVVLTDLGKSQFDSDEDLEKLRLQMHKLICKEHEESTVRGAREQQQQQLACTACGKTTAMLGEKKLLICSACTLAPSYCSVECQRACWKEHKAECKANKKQTGACMRGEQ